MDRLPCELLLAIYYNATPARRRALLRVHKQLGSAVRQVSTQCTANVARQLCFPDVPAWPLLRQVHLQCCARDIGAIAGLQASLTSRGDVTVTFPDRAAYAARQFVSIAGVASASFTVRDARELDHAVAFVRRLRGLEELSIEGYRDAQDACLVPLAHTNVSSLTLRNCPLNFVALPRLQELTVALNSPAFNTRFKISRLEALRLEAPSFAGIARFPAQLRRLMVCAPAEGASITMRSLPTVERLDLVRVHAFLAAQNLAAALPSLQHLVLTDCTLHQLGPIDLLAVVRGLPALKTVEVSMQNVGDDLPDWLEVQQATGALGACSSRQVDLFFGV